MKNVYRIFGKKTHFSFVVFLVLFCFCAISQAQTPQYYNYNTEGGGNSFPFNQTAGKQVQLLYLPGDFNQPTTAPAGNIASLSFRISETYPLGPWTYTDFTIKLGQSGITTLPSGSFYTGPLTTVYYRASVSLTGAGGQWLTFTLDSPFTYNPSQSLIVDISQCGITGSVSGYSMCTTTLTDNRRNYSAGGCPFSYSGVSTSIYHMGFSLAPPAGCTSGVGCQMPDHLNGFGSSTSQSYQSFEEFVPQTSDPVTSVCWSGCSTNCTPVFGNTFNITYYANNGGLPGTIIAGPFAVTPTVLSTGNTIVSYPEYGYEAFHSDVNLIAHQPYWISIQSTSPSCNWYWGSSFPGDNIFNQNGINYTGNLSYCLNVPINYDGALSAAPINDICENALTLSCNDTVSGTTTNASTQDAPTSCGVVLNTAPGVWYKFTATDYLTEINTCGVGTNYDTKIGVFVGDCDSLICIEGNDDNCGLHSKVIFCSQPGEQYFIYVTGYGSHDGNFDLALLCGPSAAPAFINCPANIIQNNEQESCGAFVTIPILVLGNEYIDECEAIAWNDYTETDDASGVYSVGSTIVNWIITDVEGNSDTCQQTVTITDIQPPILHCPSDIVQSTDPGSCDAVVTYTPPTGFDNCPNTGVNIHLTQSVDDSTVVYGTAVACAAAGLHTNNSYIRVYDLPALGISGLNVISVDFGVETAASATGKQPVIVNLYTLNGPLLFANMTLVGSQIDSIPDTTNAIFNVPITASVPPGFPLVVELFTPDGQALGNSFYIGSNSNGQTDTTYLAASDCGIAEPTDITLIGFPDMQIILDVNSIGSTTTQMISGLGSGATFPLGTTTEVYQSTDASGNASICDINIIVVDNEPPAFTCPSDITVNGGSDSIFAGVGCSTINGFTGVYDPSFWNFFQLNANGFIDLSAVPDSITITGGDNGSDSAGFTNCSIPINCVGTITFDWTYTAGDSALYDLPRYSLNGGATYTTLPGFSTSGPDHQTGTASIPVMDGQTFVINVYTTDNKYGPAVLVISDFAAPGMTMPVATDNCGVASVTSDHPSSTFPAGVNTVTWTVTDVNGNITTCEQTVTVNSTYSISEANVESVGLYPNPTNGDLTIELSEGYEGTKIYLYSTEGKLIRMLNDGTKESKILCNLGDLAGGLYFLKFENQQAVFYKKVVKN